MMKSITLISNDYELIKDIKDRINSVELDVSISLYNQSLTEEEVFIFIIR